MADQKTISLPPALFAFYTLILFVALFFAIAAWKQSRPGQLASTPSTATATFSPQKSNQPLLQFFVMSFCPYGNQMEAILKPIVDLLGAKADIKPQYIFDKIDNLTTYCSSRAGDPTKCSLYVQNKYFPNETDCQKSISENLKSCLDEKSYLKAGNAYYASLHGRVEANQNVRELCAWKLADDKKTWWNFVANVNSNCTSQNADTCWEAQSKTAGLDSAKITECFNQEAIPLIEAEIAQTTKYNISSSPTLIINGQAFPPDSAYTQDNKGTLKVNKTIFGQDKYRSPNAIKEAVCAAFNKTPKECTTILADTAASAPGACN
jgi:hypothetical protein